MVAMPVSRQMTPEEFLTFEDAWRYELVNGELVERNVSKNSSKVAVRIIVELGSYVERTGQGTLYDSELGVAIFGGSLIRKGDVVFVGGDDVEEDSGYLYRVPDLVVEVVSPGDVANELIDKAHLWLDAGVRLVWVAFPTVREVLVYERDGEARIVRNDEIIEGGEVLPGFACPVSRFFPAPVGERTRGQAGT